MLGAASLFLPSGARAFDVEFATPEEMKPLRLEFPPRFRACEPYRDQIRSAVKRYWGIYNYPAAWVAQLYQESLCRPDARSPVGASGLAQFMPATWREVSTQLRLPPNASPHDDVAIRAGAFYMARMMGIWTSQRPRHERWRLGLASYNAGAGNIINAQRACNGARMWGQIQICLPRITGRNAEETRTYVERIQIWWRATGGCAALAAPLEIQSEWGCFQ